MINVRQMEPMDNSEQAVRYVGGDRDGMIQPFHQDAYHMGTSLGSNVMIMHPNHDDEECKYLHIVNLKTGERVRISFKED